MQLLKNIQEIFNYFKRRGFELYLIGGVSKAILQKQELPYDIDISTDAMPNEIIDCLNFLNLKGNILTYGIDYGTVFFVLKEYNIEFTTTRSDISCFGRDAKVQFCKDFYLDSQRRDFTFNAIYINPFQDKILDFHNGINDLKENKIIFIGTAELRIKEDYLRILRYLRFVLLNNASFNEDTIIICQKNKEGIKILSMERIYLELSKIFLGIKLQNSLLKLIEFGILDFIFPLLEIQRIKEKDLVLFHKFDNFVLRLIYFIDIFYEKEGIQILNNIVKIKLIKKREELKIIEFFIKNINFFKQLSPNLEFYVFVYENIQMFKSSNILNLFEINSKIIQKFILDLAFNKININIDEEKLKEMNLSIKDFVKQKKIDFIKDIIIKY